MRRCPRRLNQFKPNINFKYGMEKIDSTIETLGLPRKVKNLAYEIYHLTYKNENIQKGGRDSIIYVSFHAGDQDSR